MSSNKNPIVEVQPTAPPPTVTDTAAVCAQATATPHPRGLFQKISASAQRVVHNTFDGQNPCTITESQQKPQPQNHSFGTVLRHVEVGVGNAANSKTGKTVLGGLLTAVGGPVGRLAANPIEKGLNGVAQTAAAKDSSADGLFLAHLLETNRGFGSVMEQNQIRHSFAAATQSGTGSILAQSMNARLSHDLPGSRVDLLEAAPGQPARLLLTMGGKKTVINLNSAASNTFIKR